MKRKTITLMSLAMFLLIASQLKAQNLSDMNEARKYAQKELQNTLAQMPSGQETSYGFNSRDEFSSAKIGEFVLLESIGHDNYAEFSRYRFVVSVNGEARALISYQKEGKSWTMCGFGAGELVREVAKMRAIKSSEAGIANIVRINDKNFKGDFVKFESSLAEGLPKDGLIPLNSSKTFYNQKNVKAMKESYSLDEILQLGL